MIVKTYDAFSLPVTIEIPVLQIEMVLSGYHVVPQFYIFHSDEADMDARTDRQTLTYC